MNYRNKLLASNKLRKKQQKKKKTNRIQFDEHMKQLSATFYKLKKLKE